jgi:hypothetical protein
MSLNFVVNVTPSQACFATVSNKSITGFTVTLTPLSGVTLAAGSFDVTVCACALGFARSALSGPSGRIDYLRVMTNDADLIAGALEFHMRGNCSAETFSFLKRLHSVLRDFVVVMRLEPERFTPDLQATNVHR